MNKQMVILLVAAILISGFVGESDADRRRRLGRYGSRYRDVDTNEKGAEFGGLEVQNAGSFVGPQMKMKDAGRRRRLGRYGSRFRDMDSDEKGAEFGWLAVQNAGSFVSPQMNMKGRFVDDL